MVRQVANPIVRRIQRVAPPDRTMRFLRRKREQCLIYRIEDVEAR